MPVRKISSSVRRLQGTAEERDRALFFLRPGTKLRKYQRPIAYRAIRHKEFAYLLEPRLGKTLVSTAVTGYQFRQGLIQRWLIVAPKVAKSVWMDEVKKHSAMRCKIHVIQGKADDKKAQVGLWLDRIGHLSVLITNPEQIWRIRRILIKWCQKRKTKITIDESHRIKHRGSRQARMAHSLGRRVEFKEIATGTLFNKPIDAFSQFKFLKPDLLGDNWKEFCEHYVRTYGYGGYQPKTFKNLDELWELIGSISYSLTREEAGGFPKEQTQVIKFPLTGKALKHYREMERDLITMVGDASVRASIVLTQILRLQQITGGFLPVQHPDEDLAENVMIGEDKLRALAEVVDEYPTREPLVIFAKYKYELAAILEQMKKLDRRTDIIAGKRDNEAVRLAFKQEKLDTVVVQIRSAISISLARAQTAIYYSSTSSLIDYDQSRARIADYGPPSIALIHLAAEGTVDEDQAEALQERRDVVAQFRSAVRQNRAN